MFVGRSKELHALEAMYNSSRFEFLVLYGRRRIGKTALLNAFSADKNPVFVTGVDSNAAINLLSLGESMSAAFPELSSDSFGTFHAALRYLFKRSEQEKILLIIDEYPYMARSDKSLASVLQMLIDQHRDRSQMKLILCGSSMSFMEDEVLAYKAPLYGRRTAQIQLRPFEFPEARQFIPHMSIEDQLTVYSMTSGVPLYLRAFDDTLSIRENLQSTFLSSTSFLYSEPTAMLREELRDPTGYSAILAAIASGASRFSQITSKAQLSAPAGNTHLRRLLELGLVARRTPLGSISSRKTIYEISDGAFRFWYRFVLPNITNIERGNTSAAVDRILDQIRDFASRTFEEVCMQYLWRLHDTGQMPVHFQDLGAWWGTYHATRQAEEIDIVGTDDQSILTAECKWRQDLTGLPVLEKLRARTALIANGAHPYLYLFSRRGFTNVLRDQANRDSNVTLVTYPEMIQEFERTT